MKKYLFLLYIVVFASSCTEDFFETTLEVEPPPHDSQLVINCFITEDSDSIIVNVSKSVGSFENDDNRKVDDATVEVFQNDNSFCSLEYDSFLNDPSMTAERYCCFYSADCAADFSGDNTYQIRATAPNYGEVTVSQSIPPTLPELTATYKENAGVDEYGESVNGIEIEFNDVGGVENYYELEIHATYTYIDFYTGETDTVSYQMYIWSADPQIERAYDGVTFGDTNLDGSRIKFTVLGYNIYENPDDPLKVKWKSISRDKYLYSKSLIAQANAQGNPFAEPAPLYSNVEGGWGIFSIERTKWVDVEF